MIDVTWQPEVESLAEGFKVYGATPAARRGQRFGLGASGVFFLVILAFAWLSHSTFAIFVGRRAYSGRVDDRAKAEAFVADPKSALTERDESALREILQQKNKLVRNAAPPA